MVINRVRKKKILSLDEILVITILMEAEKSEGECGFRKKLIQGERGQSDIRVEISRR